MITPKARPTGRAMPLASDLGRDGPVNRGLIGSWIGKALPATPKYGAEPLLHLAATQDTADINGGHFHRLTPESPKNEQATDPDFAHHLWERSPLLTSLPSAARS